MHIIQLYTATIARLYSRDYYSNNRESSLAYGVCVSAFSDLNCLFVSLSALSLPALSLPGLLAYLVCSLIFANSACLHLIITLAFDFTRDQLLNLRDHHLRVLRLDFFRLKLSASQPSAGLLDHIKYLPIQSA